MDADYRWADDETTHQRSAISYILVNAFVGLAIACVGFLSDKEVCGECREVFSWLYTYAVLLAADCAVNYMQMRYIDASLKVRIGLALVEFLLDACQVNWFISGN